MSSWAITRGVAASFANALAARRPDPPIDLARARFQHRAYVEALGKLGFRTVELPADDACPDCCFVEDTCVIAGELALVTRPGASSRRAEVEAVAAAVSLHRRVFHMEAPATLDGGDVLLLGRTFHVGRSSRTNDAGIARLREVVASQGFQVVPITLPTGILHLKSVCSALADDLVLVAAGALPASTFGGLRSIVAPASEGHAANVVRSRLAGRGAALVSSDAPHTRALIEGAGLRVVLVDTSELRKADGALTCLSILL